MMEVECVSSPQNSKEGSESNSCNNIAEMAPAEPLKKVCESRKEGTTSVKVLDVSKIRSIMISTQNRMKESVRKLCMAENTLVVEGLGEVEKYNSILSKSSIVSKDGSLETSAIHRNAALISSCLHSEFRAKFSERLKGLKEKSSCKKRDCVVGKALVENSAALGSYERAAGCEKRGEDNFEKETQPIVQLKREETEIICPTKRIRREVDDAFQNVDNRLGQNKIDIINNILSSNRILKVNLGYRCDSLAFQQWTQRDTPKGNHSGLSVGRQLRRIKTENDHISNENLVETCKDTSHRRH